MIKDIDIFKNELDSFEFQEHSILNFTKQALVNLPDYFWEPKENGEENFFITHTKTAMAFANTLLKIEKNHKQFSDFIRDEIRAAILLHDGLVFLDGQEKKIQPEHPYYMSEYIRNEKWVEYIPDFIRNTIADMVLTHSGTEYKGNGVEIRLPKDDEEWFVHTCIYLASKKESTTLLPCRVAVTQEKGLDSDAALKIVDDMTKYRNWDGYTYMEDENWYVYLDGQRVPVASDLYDAFVSIGQSRISQSMNNNWIQEWYNFLDQHPGWDQKVYGDPGSFYIWDSYGTFQISDEQARILGIEW